MLKELFPGGPATLSSYVKEAELDKTINIVIYGGGQELHNDIPDVYFSIDNAFHNAEENAKYTLASYKKKGANLSDLWVQGVDTWYNGDPAEQDVTDKNYVKITSEFILNSIHIQNENIFVVNEECFRIFSTLFGVYLAGRLGYSKVFIQIIDAYLHPSRQRYSITAVTIFQKKLVEMWDRSPHNSKNDTANKW